MKDREKLIINQIVVLPWQAGEMAWQEYQQVQQREMWSPAPGDE